MKLHAVHFGESKLFSRFAKVLECSAAKNSGNTPLTIHRIEYDKEFLEPIKKGLRGNEICNVLKTKYHKDLVQNTPDGELIGLLDLDLLILGNLSEIEKKEFDLAITVRNQRARVNSGVVFVRVSEKTKKWYEEWWNNVWKLVYNPQLRKEMRDKHSGINQSALAMLMAGEHDLKIRELPCQIWNCTTVHYPEFDSKTKVVHILEKAKQALTGVAHPRDEHIHKIVGIWKKYEHNSNRILSKV